MANVPLSRLSPLARFDLVLPSSLGGGHGDGTQAASTTSLFIPYSQLPQSTGEHFFLALDRALTQAGFDAFVESVCKPSYAAPTGRPSLPPGGTSAACLSATSRAEGRRSELGIAWRISDSLSLRYSSFMALITGTNGRIGQALALSLSRVGAQGIVSGRRAEALAGVASQRGAGASNRRRHGKAGGRHAARRRSRRDRCAGRQRRPAGQRSGAGGFIRDAGMFAQAGVALPAGMGTRSPEGVAAAELQAVRENPAELRVAAFAQRLGTFLAALSPALVGRIQAALGASPLSRAISDGQRHKR